jgi:serine/threonine protein kinase
MEYRYEILELLGRGAFGTTYLGKNKITGENVVIKTELAAATDTQTLQHESRILMYLRGGGGARIPTVFWYGVEGSYRCLVMNYFPLSTETISTRATNYEKWNIAAKIMSALDYIHTRNIVHRDIKPQNIMFRTPTEPYFIDFGLAKVPAETRAMAASPVGSPKYMSLFIHEGNDYISAATVLLYLFRATATAAPWIYKNQSMTEIEAEKRAFLQYLSENTETLSPLEDLFLYFYLCENPEKEHIHKICISARAAERPQK